MSLIHLINFTRHTHTRMWKIFNISSFKKWIFQKKKWEKKSLTFLCMCVCVCVIYIRSDFHLFHFMYYIITYKCHFIRLHMFQIFMFFPPLFTHICVCVCVMIYHTLHHFDTNKTTTESIREWIKKFSFHISTHTWSQKKTTTCTRVHFPW